MPLEMRIQPGISWCEPSSFCDIQHGLEVLNEQAEYALPAVVGRADINSALPEAFLLFMTFLLIADLKAEVIGPACMLTACKNLERNSCWDHWLPALTVIREL